VGFEGGLAESIARDASTGHGGLPLMQFALDELWSTQRRRQLTFSAYHELGGVAGALDRYAERVFRDLDRAGSGEAVRRVLLALVHTRGGAAEAIRRVARRYDLAGDWKVAEELARRRLLVLGAGSSGPMVELAHEALIRGWTRLAAWVDDDAEFRRWVTAMEDRAQAGEDDLLADARVGEAERWLADRSTEVPRAVVELVERSRSASRQRIAELDQARLRAEEAARQAEGRRLAAIAQQALAAGAPMPVPITLTIESLRTAPTLEGDIAARHAIRTAPVLRGRLDHGLRVRAVEFSPNAW
jgi:hypothetical protein